MVTEHGYIYVRVDSIVEERTRRWAGSYRFYGWDDIKHTVVRVLSEGLTKAQIDSLKEV